MCYKTTPFQQILFRGADIGAVPEKAQGLAEYGKFIGDMFGRAYSGDTVEQKESSAGLAVYEKMHHEAGELPEWGGLMERTRNDSFLAGIAAVELGRAVAQVLPEDAQVGSAAAEQKVSETLAGLLEGLDEQDTETRVSVEQEQRKAEERQAVAEKASQDVADGIDGAALRNALRAGIESANQKVEAVAGGYSAFGGDQMAPNAEKARLLQVVAKGLRKHPKLAEIIKLAGRLHRMLEGLKVEEVGKDPAEIVGVVQGDDLGRLLPSELAKLATTPKLFFKDLLERQLLQYQSRKVVAKGRGPLVVCIDHSGSMGIGSRHIWASAIALALMLEAKAEKRPFAVCLFNAGITESWGFHDPEKGTEELMGLVARQPAGGTSLSIAVHWAMDQVAMQDKADVVILSDGDDYGMNDAMVEKVLAWKRTVSCKVMAIHIGGDAGARVLERFSDRLWRVPEFASAVRDLLSEVVKK